MYFAILVLVEWGACCCGHVLREKSKEIPMHFICMLKCNSVMDIVKKPKNRAQQVVRMHQAQYKLAIM
jgi:hypothetical protein